MSTSSRLSSRQQLVLAFVNETVRETGAPPTVREVMRNCGLKSPRGAELQLKALAKCGHLVHAPGLTRAYRPRPQRASSLVPILGRTPAGPPTEGIELHEGYVPVPWRTGDGAFAVRVVGHSMRDAAIVDGDLVVVDPSKQPSNGDVVLALIDGEHTVKRFQVRGRGWRLVPANPAYEAIKPRLEGDRVVGCVTGVIRQLKSA